MDTGRRELLTAVAAGMTVSVAGCSREADIDVNVHDDGYKPSKIRNSSLGEPTFNDRPLIGSEDAEVDVYYWNDYLCGHCKDFDLDVLPTIGEELVSEGVINMRLVPFPVVSSYSTEAGIWDEAVWRTVSDSAPMSYWVWRKTVYSVSETQGERWARDGVFRAIIDAVPDVDLDAVTTYKQDNRGDIESFIESASDIAKQVELTGTPGFLMVNSETGATNAHSGRIRYTRFNQKVESLRQVENES